MKCCTAGVIRCWFVWLCCTIRRLLCVGLSAWRCEGKRVAGECKTKYSPWRTRTASSSREGVSGEVCSLDQNLRKRTPFTDPVAAVLRIKGALPAHLTWCVRYICACVSSRHRTSLLVQQKMVTKNLFLFFLSGCTVTALLVVVVVVEGTVEECQSGCCGSRSALSLLIAATLDCYCLLLYVLRFRPPVWCYH